MRSRILLPLLLTGCYVQPYTPPPGQPGQPQPYAQPAQPAQPYADPAQPAQPGYLEPAPVAQPAPLPPQAEPTPPPPVYAEPVYTDVSVDVAGSNVPSVDVFYNELAPYGSWYDDPKYGWVFAPPSPSYVPYSNGHWKYTDYGFTWVSADPFGWATNHYGRWVWVNRWVWRPDTVWGPAWVQWRQGDNTVGWAPAGYDDDAYVPETHWRFVAAGSVLAPDVNRYYVTVNLPAYVRAAVPVRRYVRHRNQVWVAGPDDGWLRQHRVQPRRERYDLAEIGRYNDVQRREAERRAREHQRDWDTRRRRDEQVRRDIEAQPATPGRGAPAPGR